MDDSLADREDPNFQLVLSISVEYFFFLIYKGLFAHSMHKKADGEFSCLTGGGSWGTEARYFLLCVSRGLHCKG